ncbi:MAG: ABC transporter permease [Acidimicrobiales bacterium]
MTAGTGTPAAPVPAAGPQRRPATIVDAVASEWIKLRSLRSTWITLAVAVLLGVGLGVLISHLAANAYQKHNFTQIWDPAEISLAALGIAQLAVAVLGALAITGEYSSGMVRTSLTAVPRRGRLLAAKAAVLTALCLVAGEIIGFAAFFLGQLAIGSAAPQATIGAPHVLRAVIGAGLYLGVIGLLACGVGFLVRSTAAAVAAMVALVFVLPAILSALPPSWSNVIGKYWPTEAGAQVFRVIPRSTHVLSPWGGFGDLCLFTAIVFALAYWVLRVRNA